MTLRTLIALLALATVSFTGCKDQTVEGYAKEKSEQEAGRLSLFVGTYNGDLNSADGSTALGQISFNLKVTYVQAGTTDHSVVLDAKLTGSVTVVQDGVSSQMPLVSAAIISDSNNSKRGTFSGTIGVVNATTDGSSSSTFTMNIDGRINAETGVFEGSIDPTAAVPQSLVGNFSATRSSSSNSLAQGSLGTAVTEGHIYSGTTPCNPTNAPAGTPALCPPGSAARNVSLQLFDYDANASNRFRNAFLYDPMIRASLILDTSDASGNQYQLNLTNDRSRGLLTSGQVRDTVRGSIVELTCAKASQSGVAYHCRFRNSMFLGEKDFDLAPVNF